MGYELQDVGWHFTLIIRLGGEPRNAVVRTSDDRLGQTVDGSVHITGRLERLYPRQGRINGCLVRFPVSSRKIVLGGRGWCRRFRFDLVVQRLATLVISNRPFVSEVRSFVISEPILVDPWA